MLILIAAAIVCWRVASALEGRGTFIFWAGIACAAVAIMIGISRVPEIKAKMDTRPASGFFEEVTQR